MRAKMRNGADAVAQLTQWIGRKCRNHHPLQELTQKAAGIRPGKSREALASDVVTFESDPAKLLYRENGQAFLITVSAVDETEFANEKRVPVLY